MGVELKDLHEQIAEKEAKLEQAQGVEIKLRRQQRELEEDQKELELRVLRELDEAKAMVAEEAFKKAEQKYSLDNKKDKQLIHELKISAVLLYFPVSALAMVNAAGDSIEYVLNREPKDLPIERGLRRQPPAFIVLGNFVVKNKPFLVFDWEKTTGISQWTK